MEKEITQEILDLLKSLLVFDSYTKATARSGEFGIGPGSPNEVLFERLVHTAFPDFFSGSPFETTSPSILRNREVPLEVHVESGTNASLIRYPGILREVTGQGDHRLNVPDRTVDWAGLELAYAYINDLNLRPARSLGSLDLQWHAGTASLMLTIEFETADVEILGDTVFGALAADYDKIIARIFLKPRVSRGRMLWDWGVMSLVSAGPLFSAAAYEAVTPEIKSQIISSFPAAPDIDSVSRGFASGLVTALKSLVAANAELVGNTLLSLPFRPRDSRVLRLDDRQSLDSYLADLFSAVATVVDIDPDSLSSRQRFLLGTITGFFTDPVDNIALDSALGMQSLFKVFSPFVNMSQEELLTTLNGIRMALRTVWSAELLRRLNASEEHHLDAVMLPREIENLVLKHLEPAHIVDRLVAYEDFQVDTSNTKSIVAFSDNLLDTPVPCMRYQVSLELIELVSDSLAVLEEELWRESVRDVAGSAPFSLVVFPPRLLVEWEVYSFHGAFGDPLDEASFRDADGSFVGAQLLRRERQCIPFTGVRNGTAGLLSKELYLEWSTDNKGAGNAELLIVGRIFSTFSSLRCDEFSFVIPMNREVGLLSRDSHPVGGVDNVTTFRTQAPGGRLANINYEWRVFGRLVQKPFSSNSEWINISVTDLRILQPRRRIRRVQLEARLNGVTFQISPIINLSPGETLHTMGSGWSQDVVFERPNVASFLQLEFLLHILADDSFREELPPIAIPAQTLFRFSDVRGSEVRAEDETLETAVDQAVARGAVFEWGIPIGLSVGDLQFQDAAVDPQIVVTIKITKKNMVRTPPAFAPRYIQIDYPKANIIEGTSGAGLEEPQFFPFVERTDTVGGVRYATRIFNQATRRFETPAGVDIPFPGPPGGSVECYPGQSSLRIGCRGVEKDPPLGDDQLGTAETTVDIRVDSAIDGIHSARSHGSDGSFEMFAVVITTSGPPEPRLTFADTAEIVDFQVSSSGAPVRLECAAGWSERLSLWSRSTLDAEPVLERDLGSILEATVEVTPTRTTFYRIRSVAGAFSKDSREIQVFIPD